MGTEEILNERAYQFEAQFYQQPMPNPNRKQLTEEERDALLAFQEWVQNT